MSINVRVGDSKHFTVGNIIIMFVTVRVPDKKIHKYIAVDEVHSCYILLIEFEKKFIFVNTNF